MAAAARAASLGTPPHRFRDIRPAMSVSFSSAIPFRLRAPGQQLMVMEQLGLITGGGSIRDALAGAIREGLCRQPVPSGTDPKVLFVLDSRVELLPGSGQRCTLLLRLASAFYQAVLELAVASAAPQREVHRQGWVLQSTRALTLTAGHRLRTLAEARETDYRRELRGLPALGGAVPAPMGGNAADFRANLAPDQAAPGGPPLYGNADPNLPGGDGEPLYANNPRNGGAPLYANVPGGDAPLPGNASRG